MSTSPVVLHVVRPYASVDEYLAAEAWTIDTRAMVLLEVAELARDTAILFDVALRSGEKLIRAEGKVAGKIPAQGGRPAGLRIRFKRYGASTKAFIDRAVQAQRNAGALPESAPVSMPPLSRNSVTEMEMQKAEAPAAAEHQAQAPAAAEHQAQAPAAAEQQAQAPAAAEQRTEASAAAEPSGVHRRPAGLVDAPAHREELLARLRERARNVNIDEIPPRASHKTG